jgi:hypothetical protein
LILFLITFAGTVVRADLFQTPYPYVVASSDGKYYFKMLPTRKERFALDTNGKGILYEVAEGKKDKELWRVSGWYSFSTYIYHDGKHLVRMGNGNGGEPSNNHLAIAFYENGKLLKSYSTLDILKTPSKVPKGISYYRYLKDTPGFYKGTEMFSILTVEDIEYTFDVTTGEILFEKPVSAKSSSSYFAKMPFSFFTSHKIELTRARSSLNQTVILSAPRVQ